MADYLRSCPYCQSWPVGNAGHACAGLVAAKERDQFHADLEETKQLVRWDTGQEFRHLVREMERRDWIRRRMGWVD